MGWAVRATYQSSTGATTTRSLTVPASVQTGDFLYACFYWDESTDGTAEPSPTIDPPAGWTLINWAENLMGGANSDFFHVAYYKIASGTDPNTVYTWTPNPSNSQWREGVMVAFYHTAGMVSPSGTIEDSDSLQSDSFADAWTAPSSTSISDGALHIISGSSWNIGQASPPAGYSEAVDNASEIHVGWKELGTAPVTTGTLLYNAVDNVWAAVSTIVKTPIAADTIYGATEIYLSGISQVGRPDADITDGAWTNQAGNNTNLYASIDESTIDDADYIQSELAPSSSIVEVQLSDLLAPPSSNGRVLRYRIAKDAAAGNKINLDASVYETSGFVESWTNSDISSTFTTIQRTLSFSIIDYSNLKIRFTATQEVINPPQFFLAGTGAAANGGNVTPSLPASLANDQILLCAIHSSDNVVCTMPSPWLAIIGLNNTTAQRTMLFWKRVTNAAGETAPLVTHTAGGVIIARIYSFTGCVTTGDPWNGSPTTNTTGTTALVNGTSITTTIAQSLALFFGFFEDDPSTWSTPSGWTPASGVHLSALGNDAAMALFYKTQAAIGGTGAVVTNLSGGTFGATSPRTGITLALSPVIVPGDRRARVSWLEFEIPPATPTGTPQSAGTEIYLSGITSQSDGKQLHVAGFAQQTAGIQIHLSGKTAQTGGNQLHISGITSQSDGRQLHIAGFSTDTGTKQIHLSGVIVQTAGNQIHISGQTAQTDGKQLHIAGKETQSTGHQIHLVAPTTSAGTNELTIVGRTTQTDGKQLHIAGRSTDIGGNQLHLSGKLADVGAQQIHISGKEARTDGVQLHISGKSTDIGEKQLHIAGKETLTAGQEIYFTAPTGSIGAQTIHISGRSTQTDGKQLHLAGHIAQSAGIEIYLNGLALFTNGHEIYLKSHIAQTGAQTIHLAGRDTQTGAQQIHLIGHIAQLGAQQAHISGRDTQLGVQQTHIVGHTTQTAGHQLHIDGIGQQSTGAQTIHIAGRSTQIGAQTIHFNGIELFTNGQQIHITGRDVNVGGTTLYLAGRAVQSTGHTLALSGHLASQTGVETVIIGRASQSFGHELTIAGQVTGISYSHPIHLSGIALFTNGQAVYLAGRATDTGSVPIYFAGAIVSQSGQEIHVIGRGTTETGQQLFISGITQTSTGITTWIVGYETQTGSVEIHLRGSVLDRFGNQIHLSGVAEHVGSTILHLRGEQIGGVFRIHGSHQLYLNSLIRKSTGSRPLFIKSSNVIVGRKTLYMEGGF